MIAALTGTGLSAAAGLNAYVPYLIVVLVAKFFPGVLTLPHQYQWMTSWWALGIGTLLLILEVVVDKIPAMDHLNDVVQTAIRPSMGGLIFAATSAAEQADNSQFMRDNPWLGVVGGAVIALIFHGGKALMRPVVNATTAGTFGPIVSTIEDGAAVSFSLAAIFAPLLVIVLLLVLLWAVWDLWRRVRRWRRRGRGPRGESVLDDGAYA